MRLFSVLSRGIASLTVGENKFARALLADSVAAGSGTLLFGLDLARNEDPWQWSENLHRSNAVLRYSQFDSAGGFSVTGMTYRSRRDATDQILQRAVYGGLVDRFGTLDGSDGGQTHRYSVSFEGEKIRTPVAARFSCMRFAPNSICSAILRINSTTLPISAARSMAISSSRPSRARCG
jgi:hypothetical protein